MEMRTSVQRRSEDLMKISLNTLTATTPVFGCQQSFGSGYVTHIRVSLIRLLAKDRRRYLKRYSIIIKLLNCYKSNKLKKNG